MSENTMGNTITTSTSGVVPFSPPDPTSKSGSTVLTVHKSSDLIFSASDEDKTEKKTAVLNANFSASTRTTTTEINAVVATNGNGGSQALSLINKNANVDGKDMSDDDVSLQHAIIHTDEQTKETSSVSPIPIQNGNTSMTTHTQERVKRVREMAEALFDRVFTPAHPVTSTYATLPPVHAVSMMRCHMLR